MKKLVTVMNTIMIRKLTVVPAILGITALIISACSAGGSGGGGNSESGNTEFANIRFSNGGYSGYYSLVIAQEQSWFCADGSYWTSYDDIPAVFTAVDHKGDNIEIYQPSSGQKEAQGRVSGSEFEIEFPNATYGGWMQGAFTYDGWYGRVIFGGYKGSLYWEQSADFYGYKGSLENFTGTTESEMNLSRLNREISDDSVFQQFLLNELGNIYYGSDWKESEEQKEN